MYSSGGITLKLLHRKRGKEAIVDLNIILRYGGVIIHDCWASYLLITTFLHEAIKNCRKSRPKPKGKRGKMANVRCPQSLGKAERT